MKTLSRRKFIFNSTKITGSTLIASSFLSTLMAKLELTQAQSSRGNLLPQDPITRLSQISSTLEFTGDEPDPNHERLWNVDGYIQKCGGIPTPTEQQNVVIIGGGLSGLISAYYLQSLKPLVLEQASQFGGNSKGEILGSSVYSMGPAYISIPESNSHSAKMLNQIGVLKHGQIESATHKSIFFQKKVTENFWSGKHDNPQVYQQFLILLKSFENMSSSQLERLNKITMKMWIKSNFPQVTTGLYEYLEYYSWSSFGATLDEVAAGEYLSWQASELKGVLVFPGGNSFITQGLYQFLRNTVGSSQLRTKNTVLKVIAGNDYVDIVVEESLNKLKTIRAKYAVLAAPKFVAKKIVTGLRVEQLKAMDSIEYRSYMVGNVVLNKKIKSKGFDLYCLDNKIPETPTPSRTMTDGFTDMIFASWAQKDASDKTILTLYKAFPYQGARQYLLNPMAHNKHRDFMLQELQGYFPALGITSQDMAAVRMTLWGHAVPVCRAGLASSKFLELASQPLGNIFFANQDNSVSPSYESAESASLEVAKQILAKKRRM